MTSDLTGRPATRCERAVLWRLADADAPMPTLHLCADLDGIVSARAVKQILVRFLRCGWATRQWAPLAGDPLTARGHNHWTITAAGSVAADIADRQAAQQEAAR